MCNLYSTRGMEIEKKIHTQDERKEVKAIIG